MSFLLELAVLIAAVVYIDKQLNIGLVTFTQKAIKEMK
jgi:hypothetical protein